MLTAAFQQGASKGTFATPEKDNNMLLYYALSDQAKI